MQTYKIELTEGTLLAKIWDIFFGGNYDIFVEWGKDRGHFQLSDSGAFRDVIDFDFDEYGHKTEFEDVMDSLGLELGKETGYRVMVIYAEIENLDYDIADLLATPDFKHYLHAFIYKLTTAVKIFNGFVFPEFTELHDAEDTVGLCENFCKDDTETIFEHVKRRAISLGIGSPLHLSDLDLLIPPVDGLPASSRLKKVTQEFTAVPVDS